MIERRQFLRALTASGVAPTLLAISGGEADAVSGGDEESRDWLNRGLVLSGGGARGAYEGGLIGALAAMGAASDGLPLLPYDLVCGTSIGALNGWFVATGQYTKLQKLWYGISSENLMRPKRQYAALEDSQSGLFDRAASVVNLAALTKNQSAVLESGPVYEWIVRNVDPAAPLVIPIVWAVTNLTLQRPEYFYLFPADMGDEMPKQAVQKLRVSLGPQTVVRRATPDILHRALFASAALPIVFDPVLMPAAGGEINAYCDGGVASNSSVGIAHALTKGADVVLLDPPFEPDTDLKTAVEVAFSVYGTMQRKIIETEMHNVYSQSLARLAFNRIAPEQVALITRENHELERFIQALPQTNLRYIRPEKTLPVRVAGFDDTAGLGQTYRVGWEDVARGFTPYNWRTFEL